MKKFLCLFIAIMSCMSVTCYAATSLKDVANTKYEDAVDNLIDFKIVNGFEDSTFRPKDNVTRAQLAKMLILSLGKEESEVNAASKKYLDFTDVLSSHWGYGYIKLASDQNLINGYNDGTFKPDGNVTYAEATAMVIRALGYDDAVKQSKLAWPDNYMTYASEELDLFKGISEFKATSPANRGDIALLMWNALRTGIAEITAYNSNGLVYTPSTPMITEYLNCIYLNDAEIIDVEFDDEYREATVTFKEDKRIIEYDFPAEDVLNMYGCKITMLYDQKKDEIKSLDKKSEYKEINAEVTRVSDTKIYVSNRSTGYKLPDDDNILLYGIENLEEAINVILYVDGTTVEYMVASGADEVEIGIVINSSIKIDDEYGIKIRDLNATKGGEEYILANEDDWPEEGDIILYYVNADDLVMIFNIANSDDAKSISAVEDDYIKVGRKYYEFEDEDDYTVIFDGGNKITEEKLKDISEDDDTIVVMQYNGHYYFIVYEDAILESIDEEILDAYGALENAIDDALDLDEEDWTQKSFAILMGAVENGQKLDYTDDLEDITNATALIEEAMEVLIKVKSKEKDIVAAKKELRSLVTESSDYYEDEDLYTADSFADFDDAYSDAVSVLRKSSATLTQIDDAYEYLEESIDALEEE